MKKIFKTFGCLILLLCAFHQVSAATLLTKNLSFGMNDKEVIELQKFLNSYPDTKISDSGNGSPGLETDYFGTKTKNAVIKFQNKYAKEVLVPAGLSSGNGFVGKLTRAKINALKSGPKPSTTTTSQNTSIVIPQVPVIKSIGPTLLSDGGVLTIKGTGFSATNTIFLSIEPPNKYINIPSTASGTEITLNINTDLGASIMSSLKENLSNIPTEAHPKIIENILRGFRLSNDQPETGEKSMLVPAIVRVENVNGRSNDAAITVDIYKGLE